MVRAGLNSLVYPTSISFTAQSLTQCTTYCLVCYIAILFMSTHTDCSRCRQTAMVQSMDRSQTANTMSKHSNTRSRAGCHPQIPGNGMFSYNHSDGCLIAFFSEFETPSWAGTLPEKVGEPAGGSLTADEYRFATTGPWAMVVRLLMSCLSHIRCLISDFRFPLCGIIFCQNRRQRSTKL